MSEDPQTTRTPRSRWRSLLRVVFVGVVILPVLAAVMAWVVTRSWFIILIAAPSLEEKLGGDITIRSAGYQGRGTLVFEDIALTVRTHVGPAAQALRVGRAEVELDMSSLFSDGVRIRNVVLDGILLRFSEDGRTPGNFNFGGLSPEWARQTAEPILPPSVQITSAVIELGTHIGRNYRQVGQRRFSGDMYPDPDREGWFEFHLNELDANNVGLGDDGLLIDGEWNVKTLEHEARITGLILDERTYSMCPQMARLWWDRMAPEGPVGTAVVKWTPGHSFMAELQVDRMGLNIPIAAREFSASYRQGEVEVVASLPRMNVYSGVIRLEGNHLKLDNLIGEFGSNSLREDLVSMPYRVNLSIHDLPPFDWEHQHDWMEQVVTTAPFEMSVRMENFGLEQTPAETAPAIELPRQVAEILAKFNLTGWSLSTIVEITRAGPEQQPGGHVTASPIRTTGQAYISDAAGAFYGFPYPLDDVDAYVEFDSEKITVHYLTAKGSGAGTVRISGTISPPGRNAAVALQLTARDVPLDARFREGLRGGQRDTFDVLLHGDSYDSLVGEGLLPDQAAIDAAVEERKQKVAELTEVRRKGDDADPELRTRLTREVAALGTLIEAGPFELGGIVDMDLSIDRPYGPGRQIAITGSVDIEHAGVVYERFPYPIYVLGGRLIVEEDRIVINPGDEQGIPIATPGGGRGKVLGEVRLVPDDEMGRRVEPDVELDLRGDYLSDLLFAAMPMSKDELSAHDAAPESGPRRSLIARLLAGAGLRGWLNHTGYITSDEDGRPRYDFAVELYDGTATPNQELFQTMNELGLPSPRGVSLDGVNALLQITSEEIRLADFIGSRGPARIRADALVNLKTDPIETELVIEFEDLELERYMVDLTPGQKERTAALWDRYQPQGRYDARLTYDAFGGQSGGAEFLIWPEELRVVIDDKPLWLICDQGEVKLRRDEVSFDHFVIDVRGDDRDEGLIVLDGSYGLAGERGLELHGAWTGGQLGSPLIKESMRLMGADRHADRYESYSPSGNFDAEFVFNSAKGAPNSYDFTVKPESIGVRLDDTPIYATLDPGSEISFTPGRIALRNVEGEHAGGRFRIDGGVDITGGIDADLEVGYDGRIDSPQLLVLLPKGVRSFLENLEVHGEQRVALTQGRLGLTQVEAADGDDGWDAEFSGLLETKGAAAKVGGIEITGVDGFFIVDARSDPESGASLNVDIAADRLLARHRELTNIEGSVSLVGGGRAISVPSIRADAYSGVLSGYAMIGLKPGTTYEAALDIGGVSMSGISSGVSGDEDPNEGEIFGSIRVSGVRGSPETRRGRGALRIAWAKMADMPVALRILQLFELMPPLMGNLDFADVYAYIDGDRIVFERLLMECPTLQLIGEGEMSFPDLDLDLRFRSHGTVPVWGDLVAGLSDQLFVVEVTGPIDDPVAKLVPLPGIGPGKAPPTSNASAGAAQAQAETGMGDG